MKTFVLVRHSAGKQSILGRSTSRGLLNAHKVNAERQPENARSWFEVRDTREEDDLTGVKFIAPTVIFTY